MEVPDDTHQKTASVCRCLRAGPGLRVTGAGRPDPQSQREPAGLHLFGKVTATTSSSVTITVRHASCALQGSLGQSLTLTVNDQSVLTELAKGTKTAVGAADLPTGDLIMARGTIDATATPLAYDVSTARVWRPRFHTRFLCVGEVSSVNLDPAYLVVTVARGSLGLPRYLHKSITIDVPSSAPVVCQQRGRASATTFDEITVGDRVWIAGAADRSDPSAPVFTARRVLVHHPVPAGELTWYACCGTVSSFDTGAGTVTVTVANATRALHADIGGDVTLTVSGRSAISTLAGGVVTTLSLGDLTSGESIIVSGPIDRTDPATPAYDVGRAFVWQPVVNGLVRSAA